MSARLSARRSSTHRPSPHRESTRRLSTVAATAVVAALTGAVLAPATAGAAEQPAGKPLSMTLGAPVPDGPLKRGGSTASMTLTVTNSSDTPQNFAAWLLGKADGPAPIQSDSVVFDVTPVDAPATKSSVGQEDGGWQGMFYPASAKPGESFSVPAKGEFTWKVTVGLGKNYPTNDGDLTLSAMPLSIENIDPDAAHDTVVFKTDPQIKPGRLTTSWNWDHNVARPGLWAGLTLNTAATGPGEFPAELRRTIVVRPLYVTTHHDFLLEAELGGKRVRLQKTDLDTWELPAIPKGFGAGSGTASVKLFLGLGDHSDIDKDSVVHVKAIYSMGGTYDFAESATEVEAGPSKNPPTRPTTPPPATGSPTVSPSQSASPTPSGTPTDVASATATAAAGTTGGTSTGTGTGTGTTATVTGSMAATGSGSAGPLAAAAAALIALGGAAAFLGARRRRTARG